MFYSKHIYLFSGSTRKIKLSAGTGIINALDRYKSVCAYLKILSI